MCGALACCSNQDILNHVSLIFHWSKISWRSLARWKLFPKRGLPNGGIIILYRDILYILMRVGSIWNCMTIAGVRKSCLRADKFLDVVRARIGVLPSRTTLLICSISCFARGGEIIQQDYLIDWIFVQYTGKFCEDDMQQRNGDCWSWFARSKNSP